VKLDKELSSSKSQVGRRKIRISQAWWSWTDTVLFLRSTSAAEFENLTKNAHCVERGVSIF
jgi:hypothetical protein